MKKLSTRPLLSERPSWIIVSKSFLFEIQDYSPYNLQPKLPSRFNLDRAIRLSCLADGFNGLQSSISNKIYSEPWCMLFHTANISLTVFSSLFRFHLVYCGRATKNQTHERTGRHDGGNSDVDTYTLSYYCLLHFFSLV